MRLAILISRLLEPNEGEAVLGDLQEVQARPAKALCEVAWLVLRRQAALWRSWRPWAVSLFFVVPVGALLTLCALEFQGNLDLYLWIFRNYRDMDPTLLRSTGLTLGHGILFIILRWLLLAVTSWSNGFVLSALSKRAIVLTGMLFFLVLSVIQTLFFMWQFGGLPSQYLLRLGESPVRFSTIALPLFFLLILVVIPSLIGIRQGINPIHSRLSKMALWMAAVSIPLLFYWLSPRLRPSSVPLILVCWPLAYLLLSSIRNRTSSRTNL